MDYGKQIEDSFTYTKEGLLGNIATWILLIVLAVIPAIPVVIIIFSMFFTSMSGMPDYTLLFAGLGIGIVLAIILSAFLAGYQVRIFRGTTPLPPVSDFGTMFSDGIRYVVIQFVYMIPVIIVLALTVGSAVMGAASGVSDPAAMGTFFAGLAGGILVTLVLAFIIGLFAIIGVVRFSRTGSIGEAFNFSEILATIGRIGWGTYVLALFIMIVIVAVVQIVAGIIPFVGGIIQLIISPWITVFASRYICLLYDSAVTA